MRIRKTLIVGAVVATFAAGASGAAYLNGSIPAGAETDTIVTALQADEGVPQNLVTCDQNANRCTSHNLT